MRPGKRKALRPESIEAVEEKSKASIRAKVEHPFRYVNRMFHYSKVRYRGLQKNTDRIVLLHGFSNLLIGDTDEFG
jgi:IS5 family transposase